MILNSPYISGSLTVTGNTNLIGALTVTGSLAGTATSSSFAFTASSAVSAYTAASAVNATTALTASYATSFTVGGTLTAQTLVVQTITSSVSFVTGSTRFGSTTSNTHQFTGSLYITGALYLSGSAGIGTNSPVSSLHLNEVSTSLTLSKTVSALSSSVGAIEWRNNYASTGVVWAKIDAVTLGTGANPWDFSNITFSTWNGFNSLTERMRITNTGNVGIGTNSPDTLLTVNGTSGTKSFALVNSGGGTRADFIISENDGLYINSNEGATSRAIYFQTGGTTKTTIASTGNLGIGTSSPSDILHASSSLPRIISDTSTRFAVFNLYHQGSEKGAFYLDNQNKQIIVEANGDNTYETKFNTAGSERMKITSAGVVTLGNTAYAPRIQFRTGGSTTYSATINTDSKNDYISINGGDSTGYASGADIGLVGANRYGTATAGQLELGAGSATNNTNYGYIAFYTANTLRMQISFNGAIGTTAGGTNIYNPSDVRLKRNISRVSYGLNEILALNPSKFNWREKFAPSEENKDMLGFIAQEVQTIIPEAVESFGQDVHVNTDNIEYTVENPLRVNEKFIIPVLVKAIQELKAELDELKNK